MAMEIVRRVHVATIEGGGSHTPLEAAMLAIGSTGEGGTFEFDLSHMDRYRNSDTPTERVVVTVEFPDLPLHLR